MSESDKSNIVKRVLSSAPIRTIKFVIDILWAAKLIFARMNQQNNAGKTPLHEAAADGKCDIVNLFVSSGADVNILDNEGNTAFDLGKKHIEVASCLGHAMGQKFLNDEKYEDSLKIFKELLEIQAGKLGGIHPETLKTLIYITGVQTILYNSGRSNVKPHASNPWKKNLDVQDRDGKTPLHIAAEKGVLHNLKMFVTLKVKVDILDNDGKTAFDVGKKHIEVATYLGHIMGEQFQAEDKYEDALKIYKELLNIQEEKLGSNHAETSRTRHFFSAMQTILFATGRSVEEPLVPYSWEKDIHAQRKDGKTPLHIAAEKGYLDSVQACMSLGANVSILDNDGKTAFDLGKKHIEVATFLGHKMGEQFLTEDKWEDALKIYKELLKIQEEELESDHLACSRTRDFVTAIQTRLFETGLADEEPIVHYSWRKDLNVQNHDGKTRLHIAAANGVLNNLKVYVTLGAKVNILDNDGKSAFDLGKKHIKVATYLGHIMGKQFQAEDKYEDALKIYKDLLNIQEEKLGCDHADTFKTREVIDAVENLLNIQHKKHE